MNYKVIISNPTTGEQWEVPSDEWRVSEELDKDRSGSVRFEWPVLKAIADAHEVDVEYIVSASYREITIENESGDTIYSGYISELNFSCGESDGGNIIVSTKGFFSLLDKRYTNSERLYTSQDSGDIAWDLINYTQGLSYGNFGITRGVHPTTISRDRTFRYKNIKDAIVGMSAPEVKNGFDFEVDNSKIFNVYYPEKGSQRGNIVFQAGFNIESYAIRKTFIDAIANQVIVFGEGTGVDQLVAVRDAEAVHKSNFFLLQETLSEKDVSIQTTLENKGDAYLDRYKAPKFSINIVCRDDEPNYMDYAVGDRVRLIIAQYDVDGFYRVMKRGIDNKGTVNITFDVI